MAIEALILPAESAEYGDLKRKIGQGRSPYGINVTILNVAFCSVRDGDASTQIREQRATRLERSERRGEQLLQCYER
jgi:hypothetical protein